MVGEYLELLGAVEAAMSTIGLHLESDSDFLATFASPAHAWTVQFAGERYVRPLFDLAVVRPAGLAKDSLARCIARERKAFSIDLLMKVFSDSRVPALENQLDSLVERHAQLLNDGLLASEGEYDKRKPIEG